MTSEITKWQPRQGVVVPSSAKTPGDIAAYAKQLTEREKRQVLAAFDAESFEMGTVFLWSRSMAALKKQLSSLGTEFIGEMLDRPDFGPHTSLSKSITDLEAVSLAEELGMFSGTRAVRLRIAMELVAHFSEPGSDDDDDREMMPEEAMQVFRACVQSVLGHEQLDFALEFAQFRADLEKRTFMSDDNEVEILPSSPPFFRSTTIRVLMALVKTTASAQLDHVLANINTLLPVLWELLYKPDRWLVGRTYAELHAAGQRTAASGLRKALMKVHGFDYVPEDLRSRTFIHAAKEILEAHFGINNFYNEPAPMKALSELGSVIPTPAFPQCMTAVLCVRLGNPYGVSNGAQESASKVLRTISGDRWTYYLDQCLPADEVVLSKLTSKAAMLRWFDLIDEFDLTTADVSNLFVRKLLNRSAAKDERGTEKAATALYKLAFKRS